MKGIYIDGHEYRKPFFRQMIASDFLLKDHAPTDRKPQKHFPLILNHLLQSAEQKKYIFIFHDESIFNTNDDQSCNGGHPIHKSSSQKAVNLGLWYHGRIRVPTPDGASGSMQAR